MDVWINKSRLNEFQKSANKLIRKKMNTIQTLEQLFACEFFLNMFA